jgi:hypothetical protein
MPSDLTTAQPAHRVELQHTVQRARGFAEHARRE